MRISDWSSDVCSSDLLPEFAVSPVAVDAFADRPFFVDRLAGLAGHALAPCPHPRAISGARCVRIGPVLGVRWRAIHLNVLAVRPFDGIGGGEAAVGEVALRQPAEPARSEAHTSELQSLMRISYAVFCLKKKNKHTL